MALQNVLVKDEAREAEGSTTAKVIGLFIASMQGPYYEALAESVYQGCKVNGYQLNIIVSERTDYILGNILGKQIDGAIILNPYIKEREMEILAENEIPVVFLDREEQGKCISSVVLDSCREGEAAAKYLLESGHTTFAYMRGTDDNFDDIERLRGFRNALESAGFTLPEDYILQGEFDRETAYEAIKNFLDLEKPLPEAIFMANDLSAIGVIEALTEEGIKVPEQISIVGCDDIEMAQLITPSITTIRTSFERQGTRAVHHLISLIRGEESIGVEVLRGKIIPRESTCARK